MRKFKPGDWVEYRGKCYCQLLYSSNDSFYAYFFRAKYCEWIHKDGIVQYLRPRVELENGRVKKIHHPNPFAKWVGARFKKAKVISGIPHWIYYIELVIDGFDVTTSEKGYHDRPTAIRALKRLVMRLGISVEVV